MMDCDTTGIEPDIALVKYKKLVGGGVMKIVNQSVDIALKTLGYTPDLAVGVWVGNADYTPMVNTTGVSGAAPIWSQFMQMAAPYVAGGTPSDFVRPPGIVDKVMFFVAPKIIGGRSSFPAVGGNTFRRLEEAYRVEDLSVKRIGEDVLIEGYIRN